MNPSTPATNQQGRGQSARVSPEQTNMGPPDQPNVPPTAPSHSFAESFSLDPIQIKEARERVKSHLKDESIWELIESQPAPLRDLIIWFCDQMNLAHAGYNQRTRALSKFVDVKDGEFYISRSINIKVSLNRSQALEKSNEAEAEILGFANSLDNFQRCASEHMHNMAKLEHQAARKKIAKTGAELTLQLFWRLIDYISSTTGPVLYKPLSTIARQSTKIYLSSLESSSQFCSSYLLSTTSDISDILDGLAPPDTASQARLNTYQTANEDKLFKSVCAILDSFYLKVSSIHQTKLDSERAQRRAEAAFAARYQGRQIESATAATATALNGEKAESRSTITSLVQGEIKSSAPKIIDSILKKAARKKSSGGSDHQSDAPKTKTQGNKGSNKRKQKDGSGNQPGQKSKQRANQQKKQRPNQQNSQHQSQSSGGRGGKPKGSAKGKGSKKKGTTEGK